MQSFQVHFAICIKTNQLFVISSCVSTDGINANKLCKHIYTTLHLLLLLRMPKKRLELRTQKTRSPLSYEETLWSDFTIFTIQQITMLDKSINYHITFVNSIGKLRNVYSSVKDNKVLQTYFIKGLIWWAIFCNCNPLTKG